MFLRLHWADLCYHWERMGEIVKKQRLDKFISNQLILSRSVVRTSIQKGKATVNNAVVRDFGMLIDAENDIITFNGENIAYKEYVYILMNKPQGVLSASNDKNRETVVDLVPQYLKRADLAPVGRLDKDTTGLLLITDDGAFSHNCISPKKAIPKSYIATLDGDITEDMIEKFDQGVILADGTVCKSAKLESLSPNVARIIITEGKYHQIKRMFGTVDLGVNKLHRESIGGLTLPPALKEGECIEMTKEQLECRILHK